MFEDFFESPSPAIYAKMLINTENPDKNKEFVAEIEDNIRFKRQNKKKTSKTEKKMMMRHCRLLTKFLITVKMLKKFSACIKS